MTTANERAPTSNLNERVAAEIRATMARRRITGQRLARELDVSGSWVSYRLNGHQPIDLNDLERIARVLSVHPVELLGLRRRLADQDTVRYQPMAERTPPVLIRTPLARPDELSAVRPPSAEQPSSPAALSRPRRIDLDEPRVAA